MENVYDGFVSRHLNRRVSRPMARLLSHTPVTPNQVSIVSLGVALGSFLCFVYGYHIIAALLAQASSVVDGVDGDLARLKRDDLSLWWLYGFNPRPLCGRPHHPGPHHLGRRGTSCAFRYGWWDSGRWWGPSRSPIPALEWRMCHETFLNRGISSAASRDVRLLIVMVGALAGTGLCDPDGAGLPDQLRGLAEAAARATPAEGDVRTVLLNADFQSGCTPPSP